MVAPLYCFVLDGDVHCVSVESYQQQPAGPPASPTQNRERLSIRSKNILYSLNDPLYSDIDLGPELGRNDPHLLLLDEATSQSSSEPHKSLYLPLHTLDLGANLANGFVQVKELVARVLPLVDEKNVQVKQLTGGITNMLLQCKDLALGITLLMRVYGQGTNLIIDRHREFVLHLVLNSLGLAPPIYARFHNGLVYGFFPGRLLLPEELQLEDYFPLIAQQLGNWHSRIKSKEIESGVEKLRRLTLKHKRRSLLSYLPTRLPRLGPTITVSTSEAGIEEKASNGTMSSEPHRSNTSSTKKKRSISTVWELLEDWINIVPVIPELVDSFAKNLPGVDVTEHTIRDVLSDEFEYMRDVLTNLDSPVVSCHCDLLSGNIIVPLEPMKSKEGLPDLKDNNIQFIDYEYMLPAPRAFDIANHLAEWQGFDCNTAAIPDPSPLNPVMVQWVKGYLNNLDASESQVKKLIDEIALFYGMPGFYWGVWAMIQLEISTIDFDYANYGNTRFQEYWNWKLKHKQRNH